MSIPAIDDESREGLAFEDDVEVFDISMFEDGSEGSGFHIRNNPRDPFQRSQVLQRTGRGIDIRCTLIDVVHGTMSSDGDWATVLVFDFRFDPQKRSRRIARAAIELRFDVSDTNNCVPEVEAVSFDGRYSFLPSTQSETITQSGEGGLGASYGIESKVTAKWEKIVSRETTEAATISGNMLVIDNMPPYRIAKWILLENKTLEAGVPASVRVSARIRRRDEATFTCFPTLKCTADKKTSTLEKFSGRIPEDDPIYLKPTLKSTNRLMAYNTEELGAIDLQDLSDVTFTTMLTNAQK
ncbi:hypothetical protein CGCF415_v010415 [Colletotrichum fructicola]|uniref:Uncharacterized protein n=1 Tax=Colletotrichum fructicola (strain Nara gc5) TaxID=1213859 RepID=L2FZZ0_COLFN|nr:hypothetical protein CGCFRS4_v011067 [Colletotrichum fructicola]KAF4899757.1 hypothetical protein CGCF415_v010415 [Colletotrichum fructicola]KAF4932484.1 hypothetical protein CGCF245_v010557 [Colletotrichum fructicola]